MTVWYVIDVKDKGDVNMLLFRKDIDKNNVVTITPMYRDEFSSLCERVEKEESEMNKHE